VTAALRLTRVGPAATIQDAGRFGMLQHGISASGPMDRAAFARAGRVLGDGGTSGLEFTAAGLDFCLEGEPVAAAFDGGAFHLRVNGAARDWPAFVPLQPGDRIEITPGPAGNYGYARFDREIDVAPVLGSRATNLIAGLGGLAGRSLRAGDVIPFGARASESTPASVPIAQPDKDGTGPTVVRFIWGIHADLFPASTRRRFLDATFRISTRLDRMGVRLDDAGAVFAGEPILSLVSDAIVAGDVQILGDGTPIVLMRDHQPTGGYPRIATILGVDLNIVAQLRPGSALAFTPVTLQKARLVSAGSRA